MQRLNDSALIDGLQEYIEDPNNDCAFLKEGKTADALEHLWRFLGKNEADCLSRLPQKQAQELWTQLVTAAINVLKWQDERENSKGRRISYGEWLEQTLGYVAFGVDDLDSYFRQFVDFERVLYGTEAYYRDHFVHVVRVWLIGVSIFQSLLPVHDIRLEQPTGWSGNGHCFSFSQSELFAIWTMAALCHDLGYPLERIGGMNAPLRKMIAAVGKAQVQDFAYDLPRQHEFIDNFIVQFISSRLVRVTENRSRKGPGAALGFRTEVQPKYYLKFSKSFEDLRHGILSCPLLMKQLVYFLESDFDMSPSHSKILKQEDARQFFIRREILRTIAIHSCDEIYHIYAETFSFLLVICDELQEWGRPTFREMRGQQSPVAQTVLLAFRPDRVEIHTTFTPGETPAQEFPLALSDFADAVEDRARSLFRRLHKLLRSALDVPKRKLHFSWRVTLTYARAQTAELTFDMAEGVTQVLLDGDSTAWLYDDKNVLAKTLKKSGRRRPAV